MAFQLKANESVSDGIARNVKGQIEKALGYLGVGKPCAGDAAPKKPGAKRKPHQAGTTEKEPVPEIRKCFKRVRAALRLVREDLGDDIYQKENFSFRDAARPLTQVRDAEVLVETADKLAQRFPGAIGPEAFAKIHGALLANRAEVTRRVLDEGKAFDTVKDAATHALARLPDWKIRRDGWDAVRSGLRSVYRSGHRALALAAETPSVGNLHELRKQAKYLWHQLQLLEATWAESEKEMVDRTHKLSTLLGEDHDLAVLRETLAANPLMYGGHRVLKGVFVVIDHAREELERQAFTLGVDLYKESPKDFISRIEALMKYEAVV